MGSKTCLSAEPLTGPPCEWLRTVYNRGMRNDPPPPSIELRLEPDQLALYWMPTAAPASGNTAPYSVALGWQTVAQAFGLRMPTPLSLENAIATLAISTRSHYEPHHCTLDRCSHLTNRVYQAT